MEAVTFPDAAVRSFLAEHFRGVKFDLSQPDPDFREATRTIKVVWAPTFVIDDVRGREIRRWTGWLPPVEWVAELRLAVAQNHLHHKRLPQAIIHLEGLIEETPTAPAAPEALHWLGIVEFLQNDRDLDALRVRWQAVRDRYPESRFARHSSVIDDVPAG